MDVVTKGPVATAGSMLIRAITMGTRDPTRAARVMELIKEGRIERDAFRYPDILNGCEVIP